MTGKPTKPVLRVETEPVVVGGDVILECSSSSTSVPKVTELRLVYNLKENGRLALPQPTESSRFRIPAVTKARSGYRYTCVATEKNSLDNTLTGVQSDDSNEYILNPKCTLVKPRTLHLSYICVHTWHSCCLDNVDHNIFVDSQVVEATSCSKQMFWLWL